jgi:hypothetical protein
MSCPITGDAYPIRNSAGVLHWGWADLETHISVDLLAQLDDADRAFMDRMYVVGELCPRRSDMRHARRRDTWNSHDRP